MEGRLRGKEMSARGDRRALLVAFLAMVALAFGAGLLAGKARAHDGYPPVCCNHVHCKPIPPPARDGAYWVLPDKRRFLAGNTRSSGSIGKTTPVDEPSACRQVFAFRSLFALSM